MMQKTITSETTVSNQTTRTLLIGGMIAGPLFTIVGLAQALTRPGFDIRKHALSLLSNGDLGWLQMSCFIISGLLFISGAFGLRRVLRGSRGGTWGPLLVGLCGLGLIGAGCFTADPGLGFPVGTPETTPTSMSWHSMMHMMMGSISFLSMTIACFVFARRLFATEKAGLAIYSIVSGIIFFASFVGISTGNLWLNSAFVFTALNVYVWLSIITARCLFATTEAQ